MPAIMSVDFPDVVFDGRRLVAEYLVVYSRGSRTPESEKKRSVYLIKRKMKKKKNVYVPGTYIFPFVVMLSWMTRSVLPHTGDKARNVE